MGNDVSTTNMNYDWQIWKIWSWCDIASVIPLTAYDNIMLNDNVKENSAKDTMYQVRPPFYDFVIEYDFIYMY